MHDRHVTNREIEASLDILPSAYIMESWICAYESETKQQSTVWVFEDEPNATKVPCGRSTSKQMVVCFFGKTGHVATVPLEHLMTFNSEWYTTIYMPKVFGEIQKRQEKTKFTLTMRALTHRLKPVPAKTLNLWVIRSTTLT